MAERNEDEEQDQQSAPAGDALSEGTKASSEATPSESTGAPADWSAQLQAARDEAEQYKDKYLRERAEMENFRKRQERT